ncbi:hypothetical protein HU200_022948 [Digitaria exilis]|uniref:Interferon-related developmental regulator N-terminal domain-containing protein n=1 Tax=Digitaria exilis TaxID=1010633 RepID=A0A835EXW6_9POAL|nr:hypothetical protein HU200_022948 [Digitaria exilis]CAB3449561.1 unnamed protein product [Digitaria exilis]
MGRFRTNTELLDRAARPFNPKDAEDTSGLLDMCVKALQDSRHVTREKALAALAATLEQLPPLDDSRCFNIFALCGVCLKDEGSSLKERCLAYRAVGLLALTLRAASAGSSEVLAHSFQPLARTIRREHDGDAPPVTLVIAAIECLAAVTFAGARGRDDVYRSLKALWDLIVSSSRPSKINSGGSGAGARKKTTTPPQVLAAAVSTWAFLLTTIVSETDALIKKADSAVWNAAVACLAGLLGHDDRGVRVAAGEALAMCVELNLTQHAPRKDMDALAAKVSELASELPGRGSNSKNTILLEQRDLFGQIAAFLDHGERPERSLPTSVDGCVALRVCSWAKLVQLNFLTRFLGDGFRKHVQGNELFKEAFSYGANKGKVLSISKKKQGNKTDKDYFKARRGGRCRPWDYTILCDYPYTARYKPETLLRIGWQALH